MDVDTIATMVGSLGFPILACCAMAWFYATQFKDMTDLLTKNNMLTEELIAVLRKEEQNGKDSNTNVDA